jgi:hypothetical protein
MSQSNQTDDCPEDLIPTRKSLLGRLKNWQDNESWAECFTQKAAGESAMSLFLRESRLSC